MRYRMKEIRLKMGITLTELAEKANVPVQVMIALEDGKLKLVTTETLLNVARALGTSVDDLFCK